MPPELMVMSITTLPEAGSRCLSYRSKKVLIAGSSICTSWQYVPCLTCSALAVEVQVFGAILASIWLMLYRAPSEVCGAVLEK